MEYRPNEPSLLGAFKVIGLAAAVPFGGITLYTSWLALTRWWMEIGLGGFLVVLPFASMFVIAAFMARIGLRPQTALLVTVTTLEFSLHRPWRRPVNVRRDEILTVSRTVLGGVRVRCKGRRPVRFSLQWFDAATQGEIIAALGTT